MVASDHAPWPADQKARPDIFENPSGCAGLQTMVPLLYSEGAAKGRIALARFVEVLAGKPARIFDLPATKASLQPGADAGLVLLDSTKRWVIRQDRMVCNTRWTPFEGMTVQGEVVATLVRGAFAYRNGEVLAKPGDGRFVSSAVRARS